jgi:hypothetical protein
VWNWLCCCAAAAAAAAAKEDVRDAPDTPPVGDVETFGTPEWARKAERKLEKKGRFVDMADCEKKLIEWC